jgi:chemosensory pili system protein ChpA (sensor histidine kinase/response regulator)
MLRNALVHGIEDPAARTAAGKAESGKISIALRQESNEIALIFADDGGGLNLEALRRKGQSRGLLPQNREPTEHEIAQLIFASGLSTVEAVTELAGRGVGMDVVRNDIASIGGRVDIATTRGKGTTFTVYLPLTLAVTQAVLVRAGTTVVAFSAAMIEQVLRLKSDALEAHYEKHVLEFQERQYPLHSLRQLIGNQEIVVKAIGPQLSRAPGVSGATVLADGRVALIMNPVQLANRQEQTLRAAPTTPFKAEATAPAKTLAPIVMVVDDSLTVRKITGRLLEREGYRVVTAKDGVEALERIAEAMPQIMLVDIEMPRMDGFDLTRNVRADARTQGIPIVIISSRTADKHRNQAAQLGVNAFLGKPYPEAELLQLVAKYTAA